ncbi:MAG TPA: preprotein translocase subunit YajC [Acidimicrobiales bacterium]|nr:preprotein translocase subunit YajC [Acidimicrobiales bacterium]
MAYLPIILLIGLFYLLLIRPQQQRVKAQRALVSSLSVGDEIVTIGGMFGTIVDLDDDAVVVEAGPGVRLRFRRVAISGKVGPVVPDSAAGLDDARDDHGNGHLDDDPHPGDDA